MIAFGRNKHWYMGKSWEKWSKRRYHNNYWLESAVRRGFLAWWYIGNGNDSIPMGPIKGGSSSIHAQRAPMYVNMQVEPVTLAITWSLDLMKYEIKRNKYFKGVTKPAGSQLPRLLAKMFPCSVNILVAKWRLFKKDSYQDRWMKSYKEGSMNRCMLLCRCVMAKPWLNLPWHW